MVTCCAQVTVLRRSPVKLRSLVAQVTRELMQQIHPWFPQIIHKIKLQSSDVSMTPSQICDRIFELVDKNNDGGFSSLRSRSERRKRPRSAGRVCEFMDLVFFRSPPGQISLSEFMEGAQKDEWVMNLLKLDINATSWVIHNCDKLP